MRLLVLGGTRFLGRHLVEQALQAGHAVTLLHRGRVQGLFPGATEILADRDADLSALRAGRWDAVIDTCAYRPRQVREAAAMLAPRVDRYLLVSSVSVYAPGHPGPDEEAPLATLPDPTVETVTGETYGGLKALCEAALHETMPGRALVARPGLIVGPHDPTGRFTYWPRRIAEGGEVLAPGDPAEPVQLIDARDLAAWLLRQAESGGTGVFNLCGPALPLTMGGLLAEACRTLNPAARLCWVAEDFLLAQAVQPWTELPLWVGGSAPGLHRTRIDRALASGLVCRPLAQTLRDTLSWDRDERRETPGVGLAREREAELLAAWHAHHARDPAP